ncbi:hypothetical protein FXI30_004791 [Escherichia coli]|nr:hypothetical protein [Escherichia coli]
MWNVITTECFDEWFDTQSEDLQDEILSVLQILKEVGPNLGRPYVDTLKGSKYPNCVFRSIRSRIGIEVRSAIEPV